MKKKAVILLFLFVFLLGAPMTKSVYADNGLIVRGVARTLLSVVEIPKAIISHSQRVIFPVGIVTGALEGTFRTVMGTLAGTLDIAQGAAPYAKYMLFFI
ncbi:MAG: hypothetical protein JW893_01305 [Candidatus Omnitrophica bacterium]|nr:hypothetical protein [Candidatus Omnitrophota bacterium]